MNDIIISLRIPTDLYQDLLSMAQKEDRSVSNMIKISIKEKLYGVKNESTVN